jgi:hypothetical protein
MWPGPVTTATFIPNTRTSGVWRRIVGLMMVGGALLCGEAVAESAVPTDAIIWGSFALASYAAGLLYLASGREKIGLGLANWKFGSWILLWYGLTFGLATLTWNQFEGSAAGQIGISSVLRALWLVAVGLTFWTVGYLVGPGHPIQRAGARGVGALTNRFTGAVRSWYTPWILYALGTAGRLASLATTGLFGYIGDASSAVSSASGYGQVLGALSLFAPLGVCAAALQVYRQRLPGARMTLAVLFSAELISGAAAGGKESFIIAVLAVVIPMGAARRRLSLLAVSASILIFLMVVIPFNQAYRAAARDGSATLTPSEAIHQAPSILRQTLIGQNVITVMPDSLFYLLQRLQEINSPAIILQRTPSQIAFANPAQLVVAPLADLVPRAIWHGKPILDTGYLFSQEYYGAPSTVYTSTAITPVGDLYRHGGWIPVIAGMFLLGCGVRLLDDILDVRENPHAVFLVLLLFPALVNSEQDWITLLAGMPTAALVWLSAVALSFRSRKSA